MIDFSIHFVEIVLLASVVAAACAVPGVFLVLKKESLMSDAISHALLPGIVVAVFLTGTISSPLLYVAAVLMGIVTVSLTKAIQHTRLMHADAALGMVFPFLFSIGVILINLFAGNVHLDTDAVLLGEIAYAPFSRFEIGGLDLGPSSVYVMGGILFMNLLGAGLFYKELKLSSFDPGIAAVMGFSPALIHYGLMLTVSITTVGAFESVGAILVVSLMIAPPATAYLFTNRLKTMLLLSIGFGVLSAIIGVAFAFIYDLNIAGTIAGFNGLFFAGAFLFSPGEGVVSRARLRKRQRFEFAMQMLAVHLLNHENTDIELQECRLDKLHEHVNWTPGFLHRIVSGLITADKALNENGVLRLSEKGRKFAAEAMRI